MTEAIAPALHKGASQSTLGSFMDNVHSKMFNIALNVKAMQENGPDTDTLLETISFLADLHAREFGYVNWADAFNKLKGE